MSEVRLVALAVLLLVLSSVPSATAQGFSASRFHEQCLRFEAGGDLDSARESCLNALKADPDLTGAQLAAARINLALGNLGDAEQQLLRVRNAIGTAEPLILLAEIAALQHRLDEAEGFLASADTLLARDYNNELAARQSFLAGEVALQRGEFQQALGEYRQAISSEPLVTRYYLAAARVLLELGLPEAAVAELESFRLASGEQGPAEFHALLGRALWAAGQLPLAASELETAAVLRGGRQAAAQAADLRTLALIYYGQGDLTRGNLALQDAMKQGNLLNLISGNPLLWLLLLLVIAGSHLIGESRVATSTTASAEGLRLWTIGQAYQILIAAVITGLAAAYLYGAFVFNNYLAFLTPLQSADTLAVFLITFTLIAVAGAWRRVRLSNQDPVEKLFGRSDQLLGGIGLGILLLAITLLYLGFLPRGGLYGAFYFNLNQLTVPVVVALIVVPFSELFFRAFALPPLMQRYGGTTAIIISAGLYALVLGTPVLLLVALGAILAAAFRSTGSGLLVFVAQLTLHAGLLLAVTFSSWTATLFL
jgi:membrane protease YdiL (CAAX protease family)/Tfp pilus assembly protein PilF